MAKSFPSQIVDLIDHHNPVNGETRSVTHGSAAILTAIVRLIDKIPEELLILSVEEYADLLCGVEAIRNGVAFWQSGQRGEVGLVNIRSKHPLMLIRDALTKCPDEAPSQQTTELAFISDAALKESIRLDISSANGALHNGEWKAATVLAGGAAEALLLWAIEREPSLVNLLSKPKKDPEWWTLGQYIEVAGSLNLIKPLTIEQTKLAQEFRNLIHPGRAQRESQTCDRGTALSALAAVELIVRDLA